MNPSVKWYAARGRLAALVPCVPHCGQVNSTRSSRGSRFNAAQPVYRTPIVSFEFFSMMTLPNKSLRIIRRAWVENRFNRVPIFVNGSHDCFYVLRNCEAKSWNQRRYLVSIFSKRSRLLIASDAPGLVKDLRRPEKLMPKIRFSTSEFRGGVCHERARWGFTVLSRQRPAIVGQSKIGSPKSASGFNYFRSCAGSGVASVAAHHARAAAAAIL